MQQCCLYLGARFILGSQSSILLGTSQQRAQVRGKVPINIDLSSLLLVDNSSCCLPGARFIHRSQYPVRDFASGARVRGKVPINTDLSSLLLVPDNSSCCLPGCALHGSQSVSC
jgi:hypothetical protein